MPLCNSEHFSQFLLSNVHIFSYSDDRCNVFVGNLSCHDIIIYHLVHTGGRREFLLIMSSYSVYITDDGTGIFRPVAINAPATLPAGGTRLTIPWVQNLNAGATGNIITAATTATPIAITTTSAHGLSTGDLVKISGGLVMTAINGTFTFTKTAATTGTLDNTVGSGTYTASSATLFPIDSTKNLGIAVQAALRALLDDRASGN